MKLLEKEDIMFMKMFMKLLSTLIYKVVLIIGIVQSLYFAYTISECAIKIFLFRVYNK